MITTQLVTVGDKSFLGVRIDLPTAPLLVLLTCNGFLGCGYFDMETANRLGHASAIVSGVDSFTTMLSATVKTVSHDATKLGVEPGMTGAMALEILGQQESTQACT